MSDNHHEGPVSADRPEARCRKCGEPAAGGWTECPDGVWRDLIRDAESGFYVDDIVPPRYALEPEQADRCIIRDDCDAAEILIW